MKKSISVLLLLCMLVGMFGGVSAFAVEGEAAVEEAIEETVSEEVPAEEPAEESVEQSEEAAEEPAPAEEVSASEEPAASDEPAAAESGEIGEDVADGTIGLSDDYPLPGNFKQQGEIGYRPGSWNSYYDDEKALDVYGYVDGQTIQTTYGNGGYWTMIQIGTNNAFDAGIVNLGQVYTYDGVQFKQNVEIMPDGQTVKFTYQICNMNDESTDIKLGIHTDVQIASNDYAAITLSRNGQRISMVQDRSDSSFYGAKYSLTSDSSTPFSGAWIGGYGYTYDARYVFASMEDATVTGIDSGLCAHWEMTSVAPRQVVTKICYLNVAKALEVSNVRVVASAQNGQLHLVAPFSDDENRTQTLHYKLSDGTVYTAEKTETTSTGEEQFEGLFDFWVAQEEIPASWTAGSTQKIEVWITDSANFSSDHYFYTIYWPGENEDKTGYVLLDFENTSTVFASVYDKTGTTITLPGDAKTGYKFLGWNTKADGSGIAYAAGSEYTLPSEDSVLYAQLIPVVSSTISLLTDNVFMSGALQLRGTHNGQEITVDYTCNTSNYTAAEVLLYDDTTYSIFYKKAGNTEYEDTGLTLDPSQPNKIYKWWTVTFDKNGRGTDIDPQIVMDGKTATSVTQTSGNYGIQGWYSNAAGTGTAFNFSTPITAKKTLYAKWVETVPASQLTLTPIADQIFTGKEITPPLTIKYNDYTLIEDFDFTVSSDRSATQIDSYSAEIVLQGRFTGTMTAPWKIIGSDCDVDPGAGTQGGEETKEILEDTYDEIMYDFSENEELPDYVDETRPGIISDTIAAGDKLAIVLDVRVIESTEIDLGEDGIEKMQNGAAKALGSANKGTLVKYIEITIYLKNARTNQIIAYITQTTSPLNFQVEMDEETVTALQGGTLFVLRSHNDKYTVLDATLEDGVLSFSSDQFSTYAAGYYIKLPVTATDAAKKQAPSTGDNNALGLWLGLTSVSVIAMGAVLTKKRKEN